MLAGRPKTKLGQIRLHKSIFCPLDDLTLDASRKKLVVLLGRLSKAGRISGILDSKQHVDLMRAAPQKFAKSWPKTTLSEICKSYLTQKPAQINFADTDLPERDPFHDGCDLV